MKWLLVAEGPHEVQDKSHVEHRSTAATDDQFGALVEFVRRILQLPHLPPPDVRRISDLEVETVHGRGNRYTRRLVTWLRLAEREEYDFVVIVFDEDGDKDRRKAAADAQESKDQAAIPRAIGVAIRTFDAWMLADQKAIQKLLDAEVHFVAAPEEEDAPKLVCEQMARNAGYDGAMRDFYQRLAESMDIATVEKFCPDGFRPFARHVRTLFPRKS